MTNKPKSSQALKEELDLLKQENQLLREQLEEARYSNKKDIETNSGIHEYRNFFNLSIDLLCVADTKGNFIKVNKAWEKILGYPIEELEGRKFLDFIHPDDVQPTLDAMKKLDKQMEVLSFVNRYKGSDGQWYYIEWRSFPLGEKIYAAARDITEMKQLEFQLKKKNDELLKSQKRIEESERNYRKIYNSVTDAIFIHHPQTGKIIDVNESMLKMYGYRSRREVLGKDISYFSSADDGYSPEKAKELISKALSTRNTTFEWCALKKSGEKFWVEVSLRNTIIEGEKRVVASAHDITDRKKSEERIQQAHQTYKNLIDSVNEAIYVQDENGLFLDVNKTVEKLYEHPRETFIGRSPEFLSAPGKNDLALIKKAIEAAYNGIPGQFEFWGQKKNGEIFPKEVSVSSGKYFGKKVVIAVARDITERKESELLLKEKTEQIETQNEEYKQLNEELLFAKENIENSEKRYRTLVENAFDGIYLLQDRHFIYVNPRFEEITEYSAQEITGKDFNYNQLLTERSKRLVQDRYAARLKGHKLAVRYEFEIVTKSGKVKNVEISAMPIEGEGGNSIMGIMKDITLRRKMEREIAQRTKLQKLLINLGARFINIPYKRINEEINRSLAEIGRFSRVDRTYVFRYDFNNNTMSNTYEWCSQGTTSEIDNLQNLPNDVVPDWIKAHKEARIIHIPDISALNNDDPVRDILEAQEVKSIITIPMIYDDKCLGYVGFDSVKHHKEWSESELSLLRLFAELLVNVQVKTTYEKSLRKAKNLAELKQTEIRNIIDYSPVGIVLIALDGKVIDINQAAVDMLGSPSVELTKNINVLDVNGLQDIGFTSDFKQALHIKSMVYNENKYVSVWGKEIFVKYYLVPIIVDNVVESVLANIEDISEIKAVEQRLVTLKERAEESDRLKSAFLANMSHEIRTPMNAICGFSSLMLDKTLPEDQRSEFAEVISANSQQLLGIINDIIDISKIESGQITLSSIKFSVNDMLDELEVMFSSMAKMRSINFFCHKELPHLQSVIVSDELKIKQILNNVISNAIKFTKEGHVEVGYSLNDGFLVFYVKDTGIGIPEDKHELIFERFQQVEDTTSDSRKGTGLGLPISKAFVEMLGGNIWFTSDFGQGSTFYFSIPYSPVEIIQKEKSTNSSVSYSWPGKTILVAEDDSPNFLFLKHALKSTKVNVIRAKNGEEAIEVCQSQNVDIILMDIKMPVKDGLQATSELRQMGYNMPIIAQTAYAFSEDKQRAIDSGCNYFLSKPIEVKELLSVINRLLTP